MSIDQSLTYDEWKNYLQKNPEIKAIWNAITQKYGSNFSQEEVRSKIFGILITTKPDFSYKYERFRSDEFGKRCFRISFIHRESKEIIKSINNIRGVSRIIGETIDKLKVIVNTFQLCNDSSWDFEPNDDSDVDDLLDLPPQYIKPGFRDPTDPKLRGPNYKH